MQYEGIEKGQLLRIKDSPVSVLDDGVAGDAPPFVADDSPTMFTSRLSVVLVAVIPTGCGIGEQCGALHSDLDQIPRS